MFQDPAYADPSRPSDSLIALRQFVGAFAGAFNDQSYAGADGVVWNPTGQFPVYGPYTASVEGQPITITQAGGLQVSPQVMLILLGAAAVLFFKRKG